MESLNDEGKAAVILPERFLSDKSKSCVKLKHKLFHYFNVECVLSLPPGSMLPFTGVKIIMIYFSKSSPKKEIWVYQLDKVERFTRKNNISIEIFDDFFTKFTRKVISQNSWLAKLDELGEDYNVLQRNVDFDNFYQLDSRQNHLLNIHKNQKPLIDSLKKINQKIEEINNKIKNQFSNYKFSLFKLNDIVDSLSSKPLTKDKLLNNGKYKVYGGNGIIGYYNEYIHSGNFVIIGRVGAYCGNVRYVEGEIWGTNNAIILKCSDLKAVYPPYLAKVLARKELRKLATGTAQPHLTMSKIKNLDIYLPPLNVQIEFDQWLSDLEKELALQKTITNAINNENNEMCDSIYQHLLRV